MSVCVEMTTLEHDRQDFDAGDVVHGIVDAAGLKWL